MTINPDIACYRFYWKPAPLPSCAELARRLKILIIPDSEDDLPAVRTAFPPDFNADIFYLVPGAPASEKSECVYRCNFHDPEAVMKTIGCINRVCRDLNLIIDLSCFFSGREREMLCNRDLKECLTFPFFFMHGLRKQQWTNPLSMILVSKNARNCPGTDTGLLLSRSYLPAGFYKAASAEAGFIGQFLWIDFENGTSPAFIINSIAGEMASAGRYREIVYRGGMRYRKEFRPLVIADLPENTISPRKRDVILVTGGLSGLGREVCRHFHKTWLCRIALSGRTVLPGRSQSGDLLCGRQSPDSLSEKMRILEELKESGDCHYYAFDVSEYGSALSGITAIEKELGKITGIVHCAGINDLKKPYLFAPEGFAEFEKDLDSIVKVLAPKITGCHLLQKLTGSRNLLFFICFSSIAALNPQLGHALSDYAIANSYLDMITETEAGKRRGYSVSVQWDLVKNTGIGRTSFITPASGLIPFGLSDFSEVFSALFRYSFPGVFAAFRKGPDFNHSWFE